GRLLEGTSKYPAGTEIALKVQHPGIWHKVCVDFYLLAKIAKFLEGLPKLNLKYLSLADTVRQFRDIMLPQLDLRIEAANLQRFNQDFRNDDSVTFPHPLEELTTSRVLTETFVHGTPIMEYTKASVDMRRQVAKIGLETTLNMIFLKDFIHGDLHPGNILVSEKPDGTPQLHFLDCGLVVEVGPHQHENMIKILGAFTRKDGQLAGQLMVDSSSESQASDLDVELFINGIVHIIKMDDDNNFIEKVGDYIADICFLACRHKVKLEATFVNASLAVEIMEGIAAALYPDMHVQPIALKLIVRAEMMHRMGMK
ncbi:protein kinase UbiB (Partial), partial [Seminavis robusta]